MENLTLANLASKDFYSIIEYGGKKWIKGWGYSYTEGEPAEGRPEAIWRCVEFCGAEMLLADFLKATNPRLFFDDFCERAKAYIGDETAQEAMYSALHYFDGNPPSLLPLDEVNAGTPCGNYLDLSPKDVLVP